MCVSALDCIEALLSANNNATKLKCMMTKVQFDFIKSRDKEFLSEVIIKLHETMEDFDTDTKEAKAFNKLVATLCSQYEIIMIDDEMTSDKSVLPGEKSVHGEDFVSDYSKGFVSLLLNS